MRFYSTLIPLGKAEDSLGDLALGELQGQPDWGRGASALDQESHCPTPGAQGPFEVLEALDRLVVGPQDHIPRPESSAGGRRAGIHEGDKDPP